MKIEQQRRKIGQEGFTEILDYQIEATSKAFDILFKNIYSDPVKAILRELATNAYDSHVEAGNKDKPFDIHLPTTLNPQFYIRDYGVGLSPDEIRNIYRVVFKSTKTSSNEQIGCFGLGCKTPFAYTDNYIIESIQNGKKYICNAFYNDVSSPSLAFMSNGEKTSEPNGLKITINVKAADISLWKERAREVYAYFKVKPCFLGNPVTINDSEYKLSGDSWGLRQSTYGYNQYINAIMGQIGYKINIASLKGLTDTEKSLSEKGIDLFFNIGDLSVEANREGIHLNDKSCLAIKNKLSIVVNDLNDKIEKEISSCKCFWDACIKLQDLHGDLGDCAKIFNTIKYKGKLLSKRHSYNLESIKDDIDIYNLNCYYVNPRKYLIYNLNVKKSLFFLDDNTKKLSNKIKQYLTDNNINKYNTNVYILEEKKAGGLDLFCKEIDYLKDNIILGSTLPEPPKVKRTYNRKKTSKVNILKNGVWEDASIDLEDGEGYFVEMYKYACPWTERVHAKNKGDAYILKHNMSVTNLILTQKNLEKLGFPVYNIYGIRSSHIKKLGPRWRNFFDYAKKKTQYLSEVLVGRQYENITCNNTIINNYIDEISKKIDKKHELNKAFKIINNKKYYQYAKPLNYLCTLFKIQEQYIDNSNELKIVNDICDKYELLTYIPPWTIHSNQEKHFVEVLTNYLNLLGEKQ